MDSIKKCEVAIIIPCKNEGIYIKQTLDFLLRTEAKYMSEIIIVDDNSNDNCCEFITSKRLSYHNVSIIKTDGIGAAQARNLGASFATSAKILVFCDAHITMDKGWLYTLLKTFDDPNISAICPGIGHFNPNSPTGYGQTWNKKLETYWLIKPQDIVEVPLAPGGCMAIRKEVFDAVQGFDHGFNSWGFEDVELSVKLWLFGYKIFVHPAVRIGHKFRKSQPYNVDITEFHYNKIRMAFSHFSDKRICKLIKLIQEYTHFQKILDKINTTNTNEQRIDYFKRRVYEDDWFFTRFNIPF